MKKTLGGASGTQTLWGSSRTLAFSGTCTVHRNGVMALSSSTVTGALINQGLLRFLNNFNAIVGVFENQPEARFSFVVTDTPSFPARFFRTRQE